MAQKVLISQIKGKQIVLSAADGSSNLNTVTQVRYWWSGNPAISVCSITILNCQQVHLLRLLSRIRSLITLVDVVRGTGCHAGRNTVIAVVIVITVCIGILRFTKRACSQ